MHTKLSTVIYLYIQLSICIWLLLIYLFFLIFIICVFFSVTVILLHCGSFCHENKFLVCVNIPGNKPHYDYDFKQSLVVSFSLTSKFVIKQHASLFLKCLFALDSEFQLPLVLPHTHREAFSPCGSVQPAGPLPASPHVRAHYSWSNVLLHATQNLPAGAFSSCPAINN